jgi:hypothetical protein
MAMSRSFEDTLTTSRPSMRTLPASIGSRPASIRSAVDFPDPDGPTRTTSSPSAIVRLSLSTAGFAPGV